MPKHSQHRKPSLQRLSTSVRNQGNQLLRTGSRFTSFDQVRQRHFWSSYFFSPDANGYISAGRYPIFVTPSGSNGQGFPSGTTLSDRETNWKSQNRVPDNQNFEITELGVSLGVVTRDLVAGAGPDSDNHQVFPRTNYQFLSNTVLSITYLTNAVPLGLCCDFGQASAAHVGTYAPNIGTSSLNASFRSNGFPAPALRRRFKIPILLQHGETFAFAFEVPRSFYIGVSPENVSETINSVIMRMDFWATESFVEKS